MNLVVFDLEWNSAAPGKKGAKESLPQLPFEIIEIGAVRLGRKGAESEQFSAQVKAQVYTKLNKYIAKVTGRSQESLAEGEPFTQVARDFSHFVGANAVMASWGRSDPHVLRDNLNFYNLDCSVFQKALNIQKLFSHLAEDGQKQQQRSIEYALEFLGMETDLPFHLALTDAVYAARILQALIKDIGCSDPEELLQSYIYEPFINRKTTWNVTAKRHNKLENIVNEQSFACPACGRKLDGKQEELTCLRKKKRWSFPLYCEEHGKVMCTIERKKNQSKQQYQFDLSLAYPK